MPPRLLDQLVARWHTRIGSDGVHAVVNASISDNGQNRPVSFVYLRASKGAANTNGSAQFQDPLFDPRIAAAVNVGLTPAFFN